MIDYCIDTPPLVSPPVSYASVASFEPRRQESKVLVERTEFATSRVVHDLFSVLTGARAPTVIPEVREVPIAVHTPTLRESTPKPALTATASSQDTDIERIAKQRVKLMAAKYASGNESAELVARLEILNRRLLDRAPRVSKEQVAALEDASEQLARIQAAREERSKRLGIPIQL